MEIEKKEPNDKHGNLNHFLAEEMETETNEYDMMDYGMQRMVIDKFKALGGLQFLVNIVYRHGFAQCLDSFVFKSLGHHYMNNFVDTVLKGWQCLVKYVLMVMVSLLRFFLYMVDRVMDIWHSGLTQLAALMMWWLCSVSLTRSTGRALGSMTLSWMASMPMSLAQELRGKELQFGLMAFILVCITWFLAMMNRDWMGIQWMKTCQTSRMTRLEKRCASRKHCSERRKLVAVIFLCSIGHFHAMQQQQAMLERVMALAEAATRAAVAAERATTQTVQTAATVESASSSSVYRQHQGYSRIQTRIVEKMQ